MVRRLVQQQDVRLFQQQPRQIHARLFAAGQARKKLRAHGGRNIQTVANFVGLRLRFIPALGEIPRRERVIAPQDVLRRVLGHLLLQLPHLAGDLVQPRERRVQQIQHGVLRRIARNLGDKPHLFARGKGDLAGVIVQLAGENFEERRLARAVFAEQPHPFAGLNVKRHAVE